MKAPILTLILAAITASSASAETKLLMESFMQKAELGTSLLDSGGWTRGAKESRFTLTEGVDSAGAAGLLQAGGVFCTLRNAPKPEAGSVANFFLVLARPGKAEMRGCRVMFETKGASTNAGYGINFDYVAEKNTFSFYNRTGTVNNTKGAVTASAAEPVWIKGSFVRTGPTTGTLTVSYFKDIAHQQLIGTQVSENVSIASADGKALPDKSVAIRLVGPESSLVLDAMMFKSVP